LDEGYIRLPGVLTEEEVLELERVFDAFVEGKMNVPGKDFCDMSQAVRIRRRKGGSEEEGGEYMLSVCLNRAFDLLCPAFLIQPIFISSPSPPPLQFGGPFQDWRLAMQCCHVNTTLLYQNVSEARALFLISLPLPPSLPSFL